MITKLIFPDSFDFGMPTASLVPVHSRGIDKGFIQKRAALFDNEYDRFERKPGYTYLHLITVGAGERYGSNNNGDYFNKTAAQHRAPYPKFGCNIVEELDGGLLKFHNTMFEKHAGIYKHHKNRHKKGVPSGYIVKAAYNDPMDRGELICGVETDKWSEELQKMANEDPIYWSMGCDTPADCCSYCNNRAHSREEYCRHLKEAMLSIDSNGNQVFAITDTPYFHDMSRVIKPADKICYTLRKVASQGILSGADLAEIYGMSPSVELMEQFMHKKASDRLTLLRKLAEIEKEIMLAPHGSPKKSLMTAFEGGSGFGDVDDSVVQRLSSKPTSAVLGAMKDKLVVMPVDVFFKLILGDRYPEAEPLMPDAKECVPGILGRLLEDPGLGELLGDGSYETEHGSDRSVKEDAESMVPACSISEEPVKMRIVRAVMRASPSGSGKTTIIKTGSIRGSPAAEFLAKEYARYVISFAEGLPVERNRLTVAQMLATVI